MLLQQHSQIPVSISTSQGVTIAHSGIHVDQNQEHIGGNQTENQNIVAQNNGHNLVQVQVQDNLVSVIEDGKDQKDILANQIAQAQMQMSENQHLHQHTMTMQQLQHLQVRFFKFRCVYRDVKVQQALDNVVRMESNDNQNNDGSEGMTENMHIVKDEKTLQNCTRLFSSQFGLQDVKANVMDVRTADGSIVKISTGIQEQDLAKTLGVEMVQSMYKVGG